jgi:hypothetical protein
MWIVAASRHRLGGTHTPPPSRVALVPDGEQSNGGVSGVHKVMLAKLR